MGKTDFVLWLMEHAYDLGYFRYFGLNQHVKNAAFEYDFIDNLETLKIRCKTLGKKYFFFLDELGKSAPKDVPWNKLNLELIQELEIIRKYRLTLASCSIGTVDRRITSPDHLDYLIEKTSLTAARIINFRRLYSTMIYNIPKTSIAFKEFEPAYFKLKAENNALIQTPLLKRFERLKNGERDSAIWEHRQQKKRDILKLYDLIASQSHTYRQEDLG